MQKLVEENLSALAEPCRRKVRRLDLFDSALRPDFHIETSDLNFLVDFDNYTAADAADRFLGHFVDLEDLFGRRVDLVSAKSTRNPFFRESVDRTRVPVYAARSFQAIVEHAAGRLVRKIFVDLPTSCRAK